MSTRMRGWIRLSLLGASAILISACATAPRDSVPCTILQQHGVCVAVPVHGDVHQEEAKALAPAPAGLAYLYIARPYAQQRSTKSQVFVDDVLLAELGPKTFARITVRPGTHTIKVTADDLKPVSISVETKDETFLEYQIVERFLSAQPHLRSISRDRAKDAIQTLDRVLTKID